MPDPKDLKPKISVSKGAARKLPPGTTIEELGAAAAREAAAGQLARMAAEFKEAGIDLLALLDGTEAVDVLKQGLGLGNPSKDGRGAIGQQPPEGKSGEQFENPLGDLGVDLPRNERRGPRIGMPTFDDIQDGLTSQGGTEPGAPPTASGGTISENGHSSYTDYSDGSSVHKEVWTTPDSSHVATTTRDAAGNEKSVEVIVTGDHSAVITDTRDAAGHTTSHAAGDLDVIYNEFDRRLRAGGGGLTRSVDPDAPTGGSYYHPLTGQYWGPPRRRDVNQVNPGREQGTTGPAGPRLSLDPDILVTNPNPVDPEVRGTPRDIREGNPNQVDPPPRP